MDDQLDRKIILEELNKNIFVIAGAGSGKTTMLVNRMVSMVEAGIDISNICAITFTVNAAARFLVDFQKKLKFRMTVSDDHKPENGSELGASSPKKREYCKKAIENIDLCFAGTIDSFCQKVLSEIPYDAGVPSSTSLLSDDDLSSIYKKMFKDISNEPNELTFEYNDFIRLHSNPAEIFSLSINKIRELTALDFQYDDLNINLNDKYNDFKNNYLNKLKADIDKLKSFENYSCENNVKENFKNNFYIFKKRIDGLFNSINLSNCDDRLKTIKKLISNIAFDVDPELDYINFGYTKGMAGNVNRYELKKDEFIDSIIVEYNKIKYDYSIPFLVKASNYITCKLKEEGLLTFNDYLLVLRDALRNDMLNGRHLIEHINQKYKYFLLDESQDTSPFQTDIFLYLTSEVTSINKHDLKPRPGSLFIVGDPKQSIYRFKGADVISYNDTQSMFNDENNIVVKLTNNFRSTNQLCDYFNKRFENLDFYTAIPLTKDNVNNTGIYRSDTNSYIDVIKSMINNPKYYLKFDDDKDDINDLVMIDGKRCRYIKYKDFMLITFSTTKHQDIMNNLESNNIPYFVEGKFNVNDKELLRLVHAIYYYLVYKGRSDALYNLLSSPLFNLNINDSVSIKNNIELMPLNIKELINKIDNINDNDPIMVFDKILYDLNIFDQIGYKNMELLYFLGEKIRNEIAHNNISTISECEKYIRNFMASKLERYINMDFDFKGVYLANLHKVKGLERPVVILINSQMGTKGASDASDYLNNKSYLFNIEKKNGDISVSILSTDKYDDVKENELKELDKEVERLKYVAVTRARSYLIIEDGKRSNWYWNDLIFEDFLRFKLEPKELDIKECNDDLCNNNDIVFNNELPYIDESPSKIKKAHKKNDEDIDLSDYKEKTSDATLLGTIIHRIMELIVKSNDLYKKEDCIKIISSEFELNDKLINVLNDVYDKIHSGGYNQENGKENDILPILLKAEEKYCEVPFSYKENNIIHQGIIDLLYKLDGKWYIVDYKTNFESKGLDDLYEGQLNAYKKAIKEIDNIEAEAYIYHIDK
ncbi:MAG: UvrD-helicase domain-containing protein [Acholeplasmatales bacterium]|nr:UvrD-helicase domain-containing protein [Acholeplasmatales bacterium]